MLRTTVALPPVSATTWWPPTVLMPGAVAVQLNDTPGANSVTRQSVMGSFGCVIRAVLPRSSGPASSRSTRSMPAVHSGHRSTSTSVSQIRSGSASILMEVANRRLLMPGPYRPVPAPTPERRPAVAKLRQAGDDAGRGLCG